MIDMLKKHPTPWKTTREGENVYLWDANQKLISITGRQSHFGLFEFIAETINNSVRSRITDAPCACPACNWQGTIWDCESDMDEGSLQCPKCLTLIKVYA